MVKISTLLTLSLTTLLLISTIQAQVTYVDASASGLNDGSSWDNAYILLDDALDKFNGTTVVTDEEIWVAAGTYKPGRDMADTSSTFLINAPVDLYGGFNGTETDRDQRDVTTNQVILSGDLMDNDAGAMDSLNRIDNVRHVVFVDGSVPKRITFDGFTITGGQTSDNGGDDFLNRAGGGILSFSAMVINNCTFSNNFGRSGASIVFDNTGESITDEVLLSNCSFDSNMSSSQSAGPIFYEVDDIDVKACSFTNNMTNRGCCYPVDCTNVLIEDCLFENNTNPTGTGGGMFVWQTSNFRLINTDFIKNSANSAGAVYYDAREIVLGDMSLLVQGCNFTDNDAVARCGGFRINEGKNMVFDDNEFSLNSGEDSGGFYFDGTDSPKSDLDNLLVTNCTFRTNQALAGRGGGLRTFRGSCRILNSTFLGNVAAGGNSGGAVYLSGDAKSVEINDCFFGTNAANFGASVTIYGDSTNAVVKNSSFLTNSSDAWGAGIHAGFKASVAVDSCFFRGNSGSSGGAISAQNDSTTLIISNSEFLRNNCSNNGGAIFTTGGSYTSIFNCLLQENEGNFGGALAFSSGDNPRIDTARFLLRNSVIFANTATEQGGGVNISDINGRIENCLIHNNTADTEGRGGALSHNVADSMELTITLDIVNSTLANNLGLFSSGIAAFTDLQGEGIINMQNTLMFNLKDYQIEAGTPVFNSLGGNFSRDVANMTAYFGTDDIIESDPQFVDQANINYRLLANSPCVDAGIASNAPERDLQGYIRDANPDIGCFEFVLNTSVGNIETTTFSVWPNPTSEYISLDIDPQEKIGPIYIYNSQGQIVKNVGTNTRDISVTDLNNGLYFILINGHKKYQANFVKE